MNVIWNSTGFVTAGGGGSGGGGLGIVNYPLTLEFPESEFYAKVIQAKPVQGNERASDSTNSRKATVWPWMCES